LEHGRIKFYNQQKGFGIILQDDSREVRFGKNSFHNFNPEKGDLVRYKIQKKGEKLNAINVNLQYKFQNYPLPKDTRNIMSKRIHQIDNFQLILGKYLQLNHEYEFLMPMNLPTKFPYLKEYREKFEINLANNLKNVKIISFIGKTASRLLVGLGNPSVLENNLTLHYIYGFPYIPGSAIKGILRNYIINEFFRTNVEGKTNEEKNIEKNALENKEFCDIFGCPKEGYYYPDAHQGKVYFFDALPRNNPGIEIDIMTPHYGPYYQNIDLTKNFKPPADYYDPIPIPFLTVKKNVLFKFFLGLDIKNINIMIPKTSPMVSKDTNILDFLKEQLKKALEFQGVGGKTSAGYGFFHEFKDIP